MKTIVRRIWDWINYTHLRQLGAALTAVIVLAAAGTGARHLSTSACGRSDGKFYTVNKVQECITVTDGSFHFARGSSGVARGISKAEDAIFRLNKKVADKYKNSYATVAYMGPMSSSDPLAQRRTKAILEGAYIGQLNAYNSGTPIRLFLANDGSDTSQWWPIVRTLENMDNSNDRLVAVVGMQFSTIYTRKAARELSNNGRIPVVGDVISADGLDRTSGISDLSRVSPPNKTEVQALEDYARRNNLRSAALVYNRDPNDLYTKTLADDFRKSEFFNNKKKPLLERPYDAGPDDVQSQFENISGDICGENPLDMVLYAGRVELLPSFVENLARKNCNPKKPITVLTGDDGTSLPLSGEVNRVAHDPGNIGSVSVVYTSVNDPWSILAPSNPAHQAFEKFKNEFTGAGFDFNDLRDEPPALTYDAVQSVARARRLGGKSTPRAVRGQLNLMTRRGRFVQGASGDFGFDVNGNPICRPLLLLNLTIKPSGGGAPGMFLNTWPRAPEAECQTG